LTRENSTGCLPDHDSQGIQMPFERKQEPYGTNTNENKQV